MIMKAKLVILLLVMVLAGGLFYYLTSSKTYHVVLPLTFDANNIPQVEVEIEGKFYLVEIDLNAPFPFALNPELFHNIAIKSGTSYIIPSLKLGYHSSENKRSFCSRSTKCSAAYPNFYRLMESENLQLNLHFC